MSQYACCELPRATANLEFLVLEPRRRLLWNWVGGVDGLNTVWCRLRDLNAQWDDKAIRRLFDD